MDKSLILNTIQQDNILPLISHCNCKCVFCSHSGNPPALKILSVGVRAVNEVFEDIDFLDKTRDIVIGESATRIIEGEPFLYPYLKEVITKIRELYPHTTIKITTNGTLLTEENVKFIAELGNFEINLSLNAVSQNNHNHLMGNSIADSSLQQGLWLSKYGVPFHGSIVAMPWLTGWGELKASLKYLQDAGALTVRVFMPGFSRYSPQILKFDSDFTLELYHYINKIKSELDIPVLLEPPMFNDFTPVIAGVIKGSLAEKKGFKPGDVVLAVNGIKPLSRVDAWGKITKIKNPKINILRDSQQHEIILNKPANEKIGIVCEYDLDWERIKKIKNIKNIDMDDTLIVTSELAYPLISQIPGNLGLSKTKVVAATNFTFGGSIACAGLMTLNEIEEVLKQQLVIPSRLILPAEMFDYQGYDLLGNHYTTLQKEHKIKLEII